jgi:hypothetical protein
LAVWVGGTTLAGHALAQSPPGTTAAVAPERGGKVAEYHLNKHTVQLPIQLEERYRPLLREIKLYAKNSASAPWELQDTAPPTQTTFTFKAPQDGAYWFTMVTVDKDGKSVPGDISKEEPAMLIIVDTQPPQAEVVLLGEGANGQLIQCDVRDAHLDPKQTRVQYQTADKQFRDLEPVPDRANVYCIPGQANITGQIRVFSADLAGNLATRECSLSQLSQLAKAPPAMHTPPAAPVPAVAEQKVIGPQLQTSDKNTVAAAPSVEPPTKASVPQSMPPVASPPQVSPPPAPLPNTVTANAGTATPSAPPQTTVPQGPPQEAPITANKAPAPPANPIQKVAASVPAPATNPTKDAVTLPAAAPPPTVPAVPQASPAPTNTPAAPAPTIAAKRDGAPVHHLLVNSTHVFLEYRIEQTGPSGVGKVEVWYTRTKGQSWQKLGDDHSRKSPAEVQLPGDGLYGLTLVVSNGLGFGAQPPVAGDAPDWWIEVDTTQPVAQITSVRMSNEDGPAVHISWTSQDLNLGSTPAELSYAVSRQGPWIPIGKNLKGDGQHRWVPPMDIGSQAFIRLTVRDLAGNTTVTETTQPVSLDDLSRPRAFIATISTEATAPAPK